MLMPPIPLFIVISPPAQKKEQEGWGGREGNGKRRHRRATLSHEVGDDAVELVALVAQSRLVAFAERAEVG
jgi:hypothetical protein